MGVPPSLLTFLGGVSAATGVNLLTGLIESTESHNKAVYLVVSAIGWILLAAALVVAATQVEKARRTADLQISATMTSQARRDIETAAYAQVRTKVLLAYGFGFVCLVFALVMLALAA